MAGRLPISHHPLDIPKVRHPLMKGRHSAESEVPYRLIGFLSSPKPVFEEAYTS
jgi:hypothetical protein